MQKLKSASFVCCLFILFLLPVQGWSQSATDTHEGHFFFAVSAMVSPAKTLVHFTEFRDYLEAEYVFPSIVFLVWLWSLNN